MPLPNFFIAGAPKSGTTSLYHYLDQHPDIYMSPVKEPHFFSPEIRPERFSDNLRPQAEQDIRALKKYLAGPMLEKRFGGPVTEWSDYLKLFQGATGQKAIGEASVCYLWSDSAAENIHDRIPNARIILVLRNPADMVFSMYLQTVSGSHAVSNSNIRCTFRQAIELGLAQRDGKIDVFHPFLDFGLYHAQVQRMLKTFSRVRVYWYEEYQAQPLQMLDDIFRFLEVDPTFSPDISKRYLEGPGPRIPMMPEDRAFLADFYREDIESLAALLGHDLSSWLV